MPLKPPLPRHGAIVLAAGSSKRLGRAKQLIEIDGETLLRRAVRFALLTSPVECLVVLDRDATPLMSELEGLAARALPIADADTGMAASLRAGIAALDPRSAGALIVLTDQPALTSTHLEALCERWRSEPERAVASQYSNVLGVPAMLPRKWFAEMATLQGDVGARELLRRRRDDVTAIRADELARDIDTPDDLQNT